MNVHVVLPRAMQLAQTAAESARGERPRHCMALLAENLDATVHEPQESDKVPATFADALRSRLAGPQAMWGLARRVLAAAAPPDSIFCSSEGGGLQLAALCSTLRQRPRLSVFVHNVDRPRARVALKLWNAAQGIDVFMACSQTQVDFLRRHLGLGPDRVRFVWDHTDTKFFVPGPKSADRKRPVIVSVGLEQRDYVTLAEATGAMDADVRISGFSKDAAALARTFPAQMPANMSMRFYEWPDLVQLYRDADVVVVSCHENRYAAGVQSLMEAMACACPIVVTATTGLRSYIDADSTLQIPPGDSGAMREAITSCLRDREPALRRAALAHELALRRHDMGRYLAELIEAIRPASR